LPGLKDVKTLHPTIERELMAIALTLENMRHIILGNGYPLVVLTDHKNLTVWEKFGVCQRDLKSIETLMEFKIQEKTLKDIKITQQADCHDFTRLTREKHHKTKLMSPNSYDIKGERKESRNS
jgi:RNase H-like domain found in reverse transcriptase